MYLQDNRKLFSLMSTKKLLLIRQVEHLQSYEKVNPMTE